MRATPSDSAALRASANSVGETRKACSFSCHYSASSTSPRTISPGRTTEQRKRAATGLKSRSLKVTMASALS
jgi:hypothetical protein